MIQTVTGVIRPEQVKRTLSHEHFVFGKPGFLEDENNCYQRDTAFANSMKMLRMAQEHDVNLVVDVTTVEYGRDPELLRHVSEESGCGIVCSTGFFKDEGDMLALLKSVSYLTDLEPWLEALFLREIQTGIGSSGVKAGVIKAASSLGQIRPMEKVILKAAAHVQRETGAPVFTHCDRGTMGTEQAKLLTAQGADPDKTVIGHMTSNQNLSEIMEILDMGFRIGFDQFGILSIPGIPDDRQKMRNLLALLERGYEDSILLSHDCIFDRMGYVSKSKPRYPDMIFKTVIPYLREQGISDRAVEKMTRTNLVALFA